MPMPKLKLPFSLPKFFITRFVLPLLGIVGFGWAIFFSTVLAKPIEAAPQQIAVPAPSPYATAISGSGVIEASSRNIDLGVFVPGVVAEVLVEAGDDVVAGQPLFRLDDRAAKAAVDIAQAQADDAADQLRRSENLKVGVAVAADTLARRRFAAASAAAALEAAKVHLAQQTILAPVAGKIFQVNIAVGEYVQAGQNTAPVVMGTTTPLFARVQIDENDTWRFTPGKAATGAVRGNPDLTFALKFVRVDPLVVPKRSLTGMNAERVDTRVLEIVYEVANNNNVPLFTGQQVDVFIESDK